MCENSPDIDVENAYSIEGQQHQIYTVLIVHSLYYSFMKYLLSTYLLSENGKHSCITNSGYLSSKAQSQLGNICSHL